MLIFLHGEDTFRSRRKLQEIIGQYKEVHKNGLNLVMLDCQRAEFDDLKRELETVSMFKEKKLIVLEGAFSNINFEKPLLDYKSNLLKDDENTIVFFENGKADSRKTLFKFLEENAKRQEFKSLEGVKLLNWAKKELEDSGAKMQSDALAELIISCGSDLWRMSNEIKKLVNFKKGEIISAKDVNNLVQSETETNIFKTIEAIANKNKKQALALLHKHLTEGDSAPYLLSMINFQFRNLLLIKDLLERKTPYHSIARIAGLHPFVVKKSYGICQKFTLFEIKKIFQKIFQADLNIKTGRVEPETALDLLISGV